MKTNTTTTAASGLGFLDNPLESRTSAIKFAIMLAIVVGAVLVIARSYYSTVTRAWYSGRQRQRDCEHYACCGLTTKKGQSAANACASIAEYFVEHRPAAHSPPTGNTPNNGTTIDRYPSLSIPTIGMVYESSLAQRRRASAMESAVAGAGSSAMRSQEAEAN